MINFGYSGFSNVHETARVAAGRSCCVLRGGYRLARERRRISIGEIVRVVRDMEAGSYKIEDAPGSELGHKVVRPLWLEMQGDLMERLDSLSVDDLCDRAEISGIVSEGRQNLDFTI